MRVIFFISVLLSIVFADEILKYPPFSAVIKGVPESDVLNVRAKPDPHAKRIGYIGSWGVVDVIKCKGVSAESVWCKVELSQQDMQSSLPRSGWVNAKFLYGSYRGYVSINGKKDCYYSLGCFEGRCRVVTDVLGDLREPKALVVEELPQTSLRYIKSSKASFDDDLCTIDEIISQYIDTHEPLYAYPRDIATIFYENLRVGNYRKLYRYIHPEKGVLISYYDTFDKKYIHLSRQKFKKCICDDLKIYWGKRDDKKIYENLKEFFENFQSKFPPHSHFFAIRVASEKLHFPSKDVVVYRIDPRNVGGYARRLMIVVQKYKNRYYIVGLIYGYQGADV